MADQVLMPNQTTHMGILEMDFERILAVPFFHSSSHSIMLCRYEYELFVVWDKTFKIATA